MISIEGMIVAGFYDIPVSSVNMSRRCLIADSQKGCHIWYINV